MRTSSRQGRMAPHLHWGSKVTVPWCDVDFSNACRPVDNFHLHHTLGAHRPCPNHVVVCCIATEAFSSHCLLCLNNCHFRPSAKAWNRFAQLVLGQQEEKRHSHILDWIGLSGANLIALRYGLFKK